MQVNMHTAKTQLSKLIEAMERGEEVIIARGNTPVARLVPARKKEPFKFGILEGKIDPAKMPDFLEPMDEEELRLWEDG